MSKEEFLRELQNALAGEVSDAVIRDNVAYYDSYLSQEMAKGRTVTEITAEIGDARIVAKTIIESGEAAKETEQDTGYGRQDAHRAYGESARPMPGIHTIDLSKWYWKLLLVALAVLVSTTVLGIVGGILSLLVKLAGPLLVVFLMIWFVRNLKR